MAKNKAEILLTLDQQDQVNIQITSKNIITNLGMLAVGAELVKLLCGGAPKPEEESRIVLPEAKRF